MSNTTRRRFLVAGGAGVAVGGIGLLSPGAAAAAPTSAAPATGSARGPIVAHIADPGSGEISVMVGETAVTLRDPAVVAALVRAAARA